LLLFLFIYSNHFLYTPTKKCVDYSYLIEDEKFVRLPNDKIFGGLYNFYKVPTYEDDVIFVCHNPCANTIDDIIHNKMLKQLCKLGSIFLYDYPGHGWSKKNNIIVTETELLNDAKYVMEYIDSKTNPQQIIHFGYSMGGVVSSHVCNKNYKGIIIINSFYDLKQLAIEKSYLGYLLITGLKFKPINENTKTLIFHSIEDDYVPVGNSLKIFNNLKNKYKKFVYGKGGHRDYKFRDEDLIMIEGLVNTPITQK